MAYDIVAFAYALIVAGGGIFGFIKKGSIVSAAMGLTAGSFLGIGAYQTSQNPNNYTLSLGVSAGLLALMGYRYVNYFSCITSRHELFFNIAPTDSSTPESSCLLAWLRSSP